MTIQSTKTIAFTILVTLPFATLVSWSVIAGDLKGRVLTTQQQHSASITELATRVTLTSEQVAVLASQIKSLETLQTSVQLLLQEMASVITKIDNVNENMLEVKQRLQGIEKQRQDGGG